MTTISHLPTTAELAELDELRADVLRLDDGPELDIAIDRLLARTSELAAMARQFRRDQAAQAVHDGAA